jgi:hypothetical protein
MNPWGESIQSANETVGAAVDELGDLITLFNREIAGPSLLRDETVAQMRAALFAMSKSLEQTASMFSSVADAQRMATLTFLSGKQLTRDQFYILLASESIEWTNKFLGLSDFEDFELMELLRFEGKDRQGYIYLQDDIDDVPKDAVDDWYLQFLSSTYRKAIIPPEEIRWSDLRPEQRSFFEKYLPDAVDRFVRDE